MDIALVVQLATSSSTVCSSWCSTCCSSTVTNGNTYDYLGSSMDDFVIHITQLCRSIMWYDSLWFYITYYVPVVFRRHDWKSVWSPLHFHIVLNFDISSCQRPKSQWKHWYHIQYQLSSMGSVDFQCAFITIYHMSKYIYYATTVMGLQLSITHICIRNFYHIRYLILIWTSQFSSDKILNMRLLRCVPFCVPLSIYMYISYAILVLVSLSCL